MKKLNIIALFMAVGLVAGLAGLPMSATAQPTTPPAGGGSGGGAGGGGPSGGGLFKLPSSLGEFGNEKADLRLKDAINYDDPLCFSYKEGMSITFSPKCMFSKMPPIPAPVFKYKADHTEPTAIVELTMEPGGGALKSDASGVPGQGSIGDIATGAAAGGVAGAALGFFQSDQTKTYAGNQNPNMPTMGKVPSVYFDGHVWGVGPLGLLEAGKGGAEGQGGGRMNALKSMTCWIADASEYWTPVPGKASAHLAVISPAAEAYLRYYMGDWGTKWYNKAGSAQVSAATASGFAAGFGDNAAFGLAAVGAMVGHAMASGDPNEKCRAKANVEHAKAEAGGVRQSAEENEEGLRELAPRATYLPAGYDQVNAGYDTCPKTGVGHFVDEQTGQIGFNNCDPQERIIQLDCSTGQGRFVDSAPGPVTRNMDPYGNPCAGGGHTFTGDPNVYVRAPSCHNRLSGYQEDGKYLACNSSSTTFANCGAALSGNARMIPGHGSGGAGNQTGPFSLCLQPRGQKTVNHLDEFNRGLGEGITQNSGDFERGVGAAGEALDEHLEEQEIECTEEGGNGLAGAAVGAGAGFLAGSALEGLGEGDGNGEGGSGIPGGEQAGEFFSDVKGKISGSIEGSAFGQKFGEISDDMQERFDGVKEGVTGRLGDVTQGAGLGSLSSVTDKAGAIVAFDGSMASMANLAESMDIMPEWLNSAVSMFNQDKIIPLYLSEQDQQNWRDENPVTKMARMNLMQSVPLAGGAMGLAQNIGAATCGKVGVDGSEWGKLCPLRGFVETSGNNFPASGLAGWRAYHKALPKIPDRKRMKDGATRFNLDYPHQSSCHPVGENSATWDTRTEQSGGIIGRLFGGAAQGLGNLFDIGNAADGLGKMFGEPSDKRAESGQFVYTYWKDTACTWDVCTSPNSGIGLSDLADVPGLEALQGVSSKLNALKSNLPDEETLKGLPGIEALQGLPGAGKVGGFAGDWAKGKVPGGEFIWGGGSGEEEGAAAGGGDDCRPPMLCASEGGDNSDPITVDGAEHVPDWVQGGADAPNTLNGSLSALENMPGAEALNNMVSNIAPANMPSLGNLGKILDFESKK